MQNYFLCKSFPLVEILNYLATTLERRRYNTPHLISLFRIFRQPEALCPLLSNPQSLYPPRIALITTDAPQSTWSAAPVIDFKASINYPYEWIFQFTGDWLEDVAVGCKESFPTIIKHIARHCPRLRTFRTTSKLLGTFNRLDAALRQIFCKVKNLHIRAQERERLWDDLSTTFSTQRLWDIATSSSDGSISVQHIIINDKLSIAPPGLGQALALFPDLESVRLQLAMHPQNLESAFNTCQNLKRIYLVELNGWEQFAEDTIAALSGTKVGLNIILTVSGHEEPLVSSFAALQGLGTLAAFLMQAGLSQPIAPDICAKIISKESDLECLAEGKYSVLPPLSEVAPHLSARFWDHALQGPINFLKLVVQHLGFYGHYDPFMLVASVLETRNFDPERLEVLFAAGMIDDATLSQVHYSGKTLFHHCTTEVSFQWLLTHLGQEKTRTLFSMEQSFDGILSPQAHILCHTSLYFSGLLTVADFLKDDTSLTFKVPGELVLALRSCFKRGHCEYFERIISNPNSAPTTPDERIQFMCELFQTCLKEPRYRLRYLDLWIGFISSELGLDGIRCSWISLQALANLMLCREWLFTRNLVSRFVQLLKEFPQTFWGVFHIPSCRWLLLLNGLHFFILSCNCILQDETLISHISFTKKDVDDIVETLFIPCAKAAINAGETPCAALILGVIRRNLPTPSVEVISSLFTEVAKHELDPQAPSARLIVSNVRMAMALKTYLDLSKFPIAMPLLNLWLDHIDPCYFIINDNYSYSLMASLLSRKNAPHIPQIDNFIDRLVKRGVVYYGKPVWVRISESDAQASELFIDAMFNLHEERQEDEAEEHPEELQGEAEENGEQRESPDASQDRREDQNQRVDAKDEQMDSGGGFRAEDQEYDSNMESGSSYEDQGYDSYDPDPYILFKEQEDWVKQYIVEENQN